MSNIKQLLLDLKLGYALKGGDAGKVRRLLDEGASALGADNASAWTPLHSLAKDNQSSSSADMAQALLDLGARVNAQTSNGGTPLQWSCRKSNVALSRRLLVNGANLNLQDNTGMSAMHWACRHGPLELALLLVRYGANVYLTTNFGTIPLHWCGSSDVKLSRKIVETAFITREEHWRRRKHFVAVRAWIYGSGAFLAKQEKLLPAQRQESMKVQSTTPKAWKSVDKVLGNPDLCRYIMEYI